MRESVDHTNREQVGHITANVWYIITREMTRPKKRGRKQDETAVEMAKLRRENERLRKQLDQAELIIAAQKKLAQVLEALTEAETEPL